MPYLLFPFFRANRSWGIGIAEKGCARQILGPQPIRGHAQRPFAITLSPNDNIKYEYYNNEFGFRFSFHKNNVTKNVTSDVTKKAPKRVNKLDFEVLRLLKENPVYTREEIAQKVGKTARTVQRALDRLKEDGKIVRIGNKVSGYWEAI